MPTPLSPASGIGLWTWEVLEAGAGQAEALAGVREARLPAGPRPESSYRAVLALDAGAVEAQGGDPVDGPLDVEDTLIASLAGLRLGQVSSLKGDGLYFPDGYQDLLRGHQLGTILGEQAERSHLSGSRLPAHLSQGRGQGPMPGPDPLVSRWAAQ